MRFESVVLRYGVFYGAETPSTAAMIALVRRRRLPMLLNDRGRLPFIHLSDAAAATIAALDKGASGCIYHVVDDRPASFSEMVREMAVLAGAPRPFAVPRWLFRLAEPYLARVLTMQLAVSNADARRDLEWSPMFPSYREGLREAFAISQPPRPATDGRRGGIPWLQ